MRKSLAIYSLALALVVAGATDVFAQRRGGGGGGGYRGGSSIYIGNGGIGFSSGNYGRGYGYGNYGYGNYGYGNRYYGGNYYGGGYYNQPYYGSNYAQPYYGDAVVQVPAVDARQSFYSAPGGNIASLTILTARPDAEVSFNGAVTSQQGMERMFQTPPLESGHNYSYMIRARWNENGQPVERVREVSVQPGQSATVDLR